MNLSITNNALSSLETKALAKLASQSRDALARALEILQKNEVVIAEVTRLSDVAGNVSRNTSADNIANSNTSNPPESTRQQNQSPIVLKFPDTYLAVNTEQQAALQALVGQEVVVKIEAVEPDIKIRIIDTVERYLRSENQALKQNAPPSTNPNMEPAAQQQLPTGAILLQVIEQVQSDVAKQTNIDIATKAAVTNNNAAQQSSTTAQKTEVLSNKIADALLKQVNMQALESREVDPKIIFKNIVDNVQLSDKTNGQASATATEALRARLINNTVNTSDRNRAEPESTPSLLQPQLLASTSLNPQQVTRANQQSSESLQQTLNQAESKINNESMPFATSEKNQTVTPESNQLSDVRSRNGTSFGSTSIGSTSIESTSIESTSLPQQKNAPKNSAQNSEWLSQASIRELTKAQVETSIQLPDRVQFPVLNEAVIQASQRLAGRQATMSDSLQNLLQQLNKLQDWSSANKRYLRSSQGQALNKASVDTIGGLKELQRYVADPKQLETSQGVKKALQQSGIFAEQKRIKHNPQLNTRQANLHNDTKVNLQRIVTATLYHMAKLSNFTTTADIPTNTVTTTPASLLSPKSKTAVPNDLVRMIKERLNAYGEQRLPAELPKRLMQLLQQVLNQSNQALQRTELSQLGNLRSDSQSPQWFFELPIWTGKDTDNLELLMRRESNQIDRDIKHSWSLMLQFDMQSLGKIRAVVKWHDGQTSLLFLANKPETYELLQQEMTTMRERAGNRNIKLQDLEVQHTELRDIRFELQGANS